MIEATQNSDSGLAFDRQVPTAQSKLLQELLGNGSRYINSAHLDAQKSAALNAIKSLELVSEISLSKHDAKSEISKLTGGFSLITRLMQGIQ